MKIGSIKSKSKKNLCKKVKSDSQVQLSKPDTIEKAQSWIFFPIKFSQHNIHSKDTLEKFKKYDQQMSN